MNVIIVGGGIGGLTAALALERIGIRPTVYEAVEEIRPLGVGINLLPHATRVLADHGLLYTLMATAIETKELIYFNKFGQEIWCEPRGIAAGYAMPQLSIHRGALQMILLRAAQERLGIERIKTGYRLVDIGPGGSGGARAQFVEVRSGTTYQSHADVIIAADGIHSVVRATFCREEGPPKWNGIVLCRATSEAPPILSGRSMIIVGYPGRRLIAYPISKAHAARGSSLINWVAEVAHDPADSLPREDWNRRGDLSSILPLFEPWTFDWLNVPDLMRAAEIVYEYPCVDRDPLGRWTSGRVTLLGDAAHPMYPIGSNGASQAILDAKALAGALSSEPDPDRALAMYEAMRRPATAQIVYSNRRQGPSEIQAIVEQRAPNGFDRIESVISTAELEEIAARYKSVAGFGLGSEAGDTWQA